MTGTIHGDNPLRGIDPILSFDDLECKDLHIAIVAARWNPEINQNLIDGAVRTLESYGCKVTIERVAGAYELPLAARVMVNSYEAGMVYDAVIAIGCLVKGETLHFEYIAEAVSQGIMRLNTDKSSNPKCKPVIYGVLTVLNTEQAEMRCGMLREGKEGKPTEEEKDAANSGVEWARTCLESIRLCKRYGAGESEGYFGKTLLG